MISHLFFAASLAASIAVVPAGAHALAAPATTPAIPPHNCVNPVCPGKLASAQKFTADEFNKYAADIKPQDEAAKN